MAVSFDLQDGCFVYVSFEPVTCIVSEFSY